MMKRPLIVATPYTFEIITNTILSTQFLWLIQEKEKDISHLLKVASMIPLQVCNYELLDL